MNADDLTRLLHETVDGVAPATPALAPVRSEGRRRLVRRRVATVLGSAALAVVAVTGISLALQPSSDDALSYTDGTPTSGPNDLDPSEVVGVRPTTIDQVITPPANPPYVLDRFGGTEWDRHGESVQIKSNGDGTWTYRTYRACSATVVTACDKPNGDVFVATVGFMITHTDEAGTVAYAEIQSNDDPEGQPSGALTLTLDAATGQLLLDPPSGGPGAINDVQHFCGPSTTATADCGA